MRSLAHWSPSDALDDRDPAAGIRGDLTIQFVSQALTSYGGLELLGRYLRQIDLGVRLRQAFVGRRTDYGSARIARVLLALFSMARGSAAPPHGPVSRRGHHAYRSSW